MSGEIVEFVGVYDADSTLVGEISYWVGARLGRTHCSLCDVTHGLFSVKSEWKECSRRLSVPIRFFHRNDAPSDVLDAAKGIFPLVLARTDGGLSTVLTPADLDELQGSTERFTQRLLDHLEKDEGSPAPGMRRPVPGTEPWRPGAPRVLPVTELNEELNEIMAGGIPSPSGASLNIFGTMAHHPKLLKRFMSYGGFFLNRGLVPPREREIVILRVGWNTRSVYEFGQHTLIGRRCGLSDDEIAALARNDEIHRWNERDRGLIDMADEICTDDCVGDATWSRLRTQWTDAELCELVLLVGMYRMVAGFLNTMGVQLDEDTPGWPT